MRVDADVDVTFLDYFFGCNAQDQWCAHKPWLLLEFPLVCLALVERTGPLVPARVHALVGTSAGLFSVGVRAGPLVPVGVQTLAGLSAGLFSVFDLVLMMSW